MVYEFKYGSFPDREQDRRYCQVKGDAGLYQVAHFDSDSKLVTISGSARDGEVKPLSNIRFVSEERIDALNEIELSYRNKSELHFQVGEVIQEVKSKPLNTTFTLKSAIISFSDGLNVSADDATFVEVGVAENVLVREPRTSLVKRLSNFSGTVPDGIWALAHNLEIGSTYKFFDPLSTPKESDIIIRSMNKDAVYYSLSKKGGDFSSVVKQLPISMIAAIKL